MSLDKAVGKLKKGGGQFLFNLFVEMYWDEIIKGFGEYLKQYTVEDIVEMVKELRFPAFDNLDLGEVNNYIEHIERITPLRFMEAIAAARPDLAEAIQEQGEAGAVYIVGLRAHFIDLIKNPGKAMGESRDYGPKHGAKTKLATCPDCKRSFPVPADQADKDPECPFCKKEKAKQPPPEQ